MGVASVLGGGGDFVSWIAQACLLVLEMAHSALVTVSNEV